MASIFEELMGKNSAITESAHPARRAGKKVNEHRKLNAKNIRVESRRIFEEKDYDELNKEFEAEPTEETPDEVVLVIDPELPSDEEVPETAAEDMVGDLVYKCPICGSNYVCGCGEDGEMAEGIEVNEEGVPTECPICGDDADQILIGEIAPAEGAGEKVDPEAQESGAEEDEDPADEEETPDEDVEGSEEPEPSDGEEGGSEEDETLEEESLDLTEGADDEPALELSVPEEEPACVGPECDEGEDAPTVEINAQTVELSLDDSKFESMMTKMIRENYNGNPLFKITKASTRNGQLRLEYFVREGRKVTKGVLVGEGFSKTSRTMKIQFKDQGAFTESFAKTPSFIVECVRIRNAVKPVSMSYDYKVRVNESLYRVSGKVGK